MIREELLWQEAADESQVVYMNFESFQWNAYKNAETLFKFLQEKYMQLSGRRMYVLLDEVQEVEEWEKVINSLSADWDVDI